MMPKVNEVRTQHGLAPLSNADALYGRPPLLLYLTAEPFEYPRSDWPENVVMVGPCDWDPDGTAPDWLADTASPIVLVTTSSEFQRDARLVQTALDALREESVFVVATLPAGDPAELRVPDNARVERFVPHRPLLDRASVAVTHGGMGATQKALARGVPVCVVPFGRDQFEVARRVEVCGAGTRLPAKRLTPERLLDKVRQAMACGDGARRVAQGFATAGGPGAAADAIERRLS
jgi:MGT family glycosyltransferase